MKCKKYKVKLKIYPYDKSILLLLKYDELKYRKTNQILRLENWWKWIEHI